MGFPEARKRVNLPQSSAILWYHLQIETEMWSLERIEGFRGLPFTSGITKGYAASRLKLNSNLKNNAENLTGFNWKINYV